MGFPHRFASTVDFKTVKATCGNTDATVNDFTPTLTPVVDFPGRSYTRFGICEAINLSCVITPDGLTEYDIGGLQWQIISGGGTLSGGTGATATYDCSDEPGGADLRL